MGQTILFDLVRKKGKDIKQNHMDCGMTIFDQQRQDTHAGGSGCGCAAVTLAAYILPKIESGEWRRVLFVPTGALMSTVSFNEGESVPWALHMASCWNIVDELGMCEKERKHCGLCQSIFGGRIDLCTCADFT